MNDTGSRFTLLPPLLAQICGCNVLVPNELLGPPRPEVLERHAVLVLAAGILLARWELDGVRSVRLERGRLWPEQLPPAHVDGWPVAHPDAQRVLVATVALGERYRGWDRAVAAAESSWANEGRAG